MSQVESVGELEQLRAQVQELADKVAIRELTARFNETFDAGDGEGHADCYTADGRMIYENGEGPSGREEFIATCNLFDGQVIHVTTDARIEIDGDTATQVCGMIMFTRTKDRSANEFFMTGRYRDELVRTPEGWRFKTRRPEADLHSMSLFDKLGIG